MKLSDLAPNPNNPRRITDDKLKMLSKSLDAFGDLSGVLYNETTRRLFGGHMRKRVFPPESEIVLEERFIEPTRTGTTALGYIVVDGEKFGYRQVRWEELTEKAAALAANRGAGEWDMPRLSDWLVELDQHNYDLDLTGFSAQEIEDIVAPYRTMPEDEEPEQEEDDDEQESPTYVFPGEGLGRSFRVHQGDCLEVLRGLPSDSVDALVTDPPAGIAFMNKAWDSDKGGRDKWIEWMTEVMREALRALKPGGHGLVWALPRTSHWTATAMENAGFQIRDSICHLFGSGFPKSLDVSKAIDRADGLEREDVGPHHSIVGKGSIFGKEFSNPIGPRTTLAASAAWEGWGTSLKPAQENWLLVRKPLSEKTVAENVLKWGCGAINVDGGRIGGLSDEKRPDSCPECGSIQDDSFVNFAERKTGLVAGERSTDSAGLSVGGSPSDAVSTTLSGLSTKTDTSDLNSGRTKNENIVTSSSTDSFGGNQSPADTSSITETKTSKTTESKTCTLCGALITVECTRGNQKNMRSEGRLQNIVNDGVKNILNTKRLEPKPCVNSEPKGRFPSNLILSHSPGCVEVACEENCAVRLLDEQSGESKTPKSVSRNARVDTGKYGDFGAVTTECAGDSGGASRFFKVFSASRFMYCAKSAKSERDNGLGEMEEKTAGERTGRKDGSAGITAYAGATGPARNFHPTVKPVRLMRYLVRLITPPNGTVLDCFTGSGSTGIGALAEGFDFIGIEQSAEYVEIARTRLGAGFPKATRE